MNESKHTPGPWILEPHEPGDKLLYISGPQKWNPGCSFVYVDHDDSDHEEMKANAHLIAAAPELLEAALFAFHYESAFGDCKCRSLLDKLQAAIDKAVEGGTPNGNV